MKMVFAIPDAYFFAAGSAEGYMELNAFDCALLAAGIGDTNLVRISSIIPPRARRISPVKLPAGALVPTAYSSITSSVPGQTISAAVAAAFPEDPLHPGLIMEYSATGTADEVEQICREMAVHGIRARGLEVHRIESRSATHVVQEKGAAFAAVVLWQEGSEP